MGPRVSIIIPVFNGANYMRLAIDSALAQTWADTEVVVVNDGSNDNGETHRIARSYGKQISYIEKQNGGVASALNAGIAAMTGDIFCWLSHDDRHLPEKTERQVAEWERRGRPNAVLISDYRLIDGSGATITDVRLDHKMLTQKPSYALLRGCVHGCSVFVPRALFKRVGKFDEGLRTTQDYDLWLRSYREFPFIHMPEILIESRWHDEQGSKKIDHVEEATEFWKRVVDGISEQDQETWEGSTYRFSIGMAKFLRENGLGPAADEMDSRAANALEHTLVSVVIPLYDRPDMAVSAIGSAGSQTHPEVEIIVVDDGSKEDLSHVRAAISRQPRARMIVQHNRGPGAARNIGWKAAKGRYVAFLDADDLFVPTKITEQLRAMLAEGKCFSHTSYQRYLDGTIARFNTGAGNRFPDIIGSCGIATPTVMVKRDLVDEGFSFREDIRIGEDVILWLQIASRYETFGIDKALTVVRASKASVAYDRTKQLEGLNYIIEEIERSPNLYQHSSQVELLKSMYRDLSRTEE
jgi:glycosyltransferase involved in cell wall biosynthesis